MIWTEIYVQNILPLLSFIGIGIKATICLWLSTRGAGGGGVFISSSSYVLYWDLILVQFVAGPNVLLLGLYSSCPPPPHLSLSLSLSLSLYLSLSLTLSLSLSISCSLASLSLCCLYHSPLPSLRISFSTSTPFFFFFLLVLRGMNLLKLIHPPACCIRSQTSPPRRSRTTLTGTSVDVPATGLSWTPWSRLLGMPTYQTEKP